MDSQGCALSYWGRGWVETTHYISVSVILKSVRVCSLLEDAWSRDTLYLNFKNSIKFEENTKTNRGKKKIHVSRQYTN